MKQILKLAELNYNFTLANRKVSASKSDDELESAKSQLVITGAALYHHVNGKRLSDEIDKYMDRKDEVRAALIAAGYDTAAMDYFC